MCLKPLPTFVAFNMRHLLIPFFLLSLLFPSLSVQAQAISDPVSGLQVTARGANLPDANTNDAGGSLIPRVGTIIGVGLSIMGIIFFVLLIYGGFLWMTARGESGQVEKAKETIIAAITGVVIVVASYSITQFIINSASGTS